MTKNGKNLTLVVFGHPELVEGPHVKILAALSAAEVPQHLFGRDTCA